LVYEGMRRRLPEFSLVSEAVRIVRRKALAVAVHTYFGDASAALDELAELPADWLGIDLTETDVEAVAGYSLRGVALGCVDSTSPVVEEPELALRPVRKLLDASSFNAVALCTTTCLKYLPRPLADDKVRALGKLASILSEEV
jgi:5-methyltetrahydropteroyltriglutamate--homocysteine methyltransferase